MANTVTLKRSSVAGKIPQTSDLSFGEVALNFSDGRLYFKNSDNDISFFDSRVSKEDSDSLSLFLRDNDLGETNDPTITTSFSLTPITDSSDESFDLGLVTLTGTFKPDRFVLSSYTVASLPIGTVGELAFVTDDVNGPAPVFFDGSEWRRMSDNQPVSQQQAYIENGYVEDGYV